MKIIYKSMAIAAAMMAIPANGATLIEGDNSLEDQIHANGTQGPATSVFGKTQKSGDSVTFMSKSMLAMNGSGYAMINDGNFLDGQVFDNMKMFMTDPALGFTAYEFSIQYATDVLKELGDGLLTVSVDFTDGTSQDFTPIAFSGPGLKDFQLQTEGSQVFSAVRLASNVQFDMIKQNDINIAAAVPEPATWMMMILGMACVGFTMRRKKDSGLRVRFT